MKTDHADIIEMLDFLNLPIASGRFAELLRSPDLGNYNLNSVQQQIKSDNILVLVDGNKLIKNFSYSQKFIIKGDGTSASIAAAST